MANLEAKIVVLGSQGVGKTSLVNRYVQNAFKPEETFSTIGASFVTKRVVDNDTDTTVRLQIWDTAGQERFRSISKLYYRGANAGVLCYDITDEDSFTEMGNWMVELKQNLGDEIILHVVGTKSDLVQLDPSLRKVPFERCIAFVAENLCQNATPPPSAIPGAQSPGSKRSSGFWGQDAGWDTAHEVSARDGEGIEEVFRVLTRKLVEQHNKKQKESSQNLGSLKGLERLAENNGTGSFRVGHGDKRKSWLGIGGGPPLGTVRSTSRRTSGDLDEPRETRKSKCC
ncbi:MAG: hypothetical protein M1814_005976 [Vezdaea aestivalis]|nr:MAG: hypothetical protein M1814_005976 [Vezdaea aestivalis]